MNTFRASNYIASKLLKKKVSFRGEKAAVESCGYLSNCTEGRKKIKKYNNKNKEMRTKLMSGVWYPLNRRYYVKTVFNDFLENVNVN